VLTNSGYFEEAIARIETAIAAVPTDERELRLQLEAEVTTAARLFPTTYARAGERLRALAGEARGETPGERLVLASLSFQRGFEGASAEEAGSLAKRALAAGVTAEHGTMPGAVWDATYALVLGEEFDAAERLCRSALAKARAGASPLGVLLASSFRSFIAYRRGQLARAEGEARTALDSARAVGAEMGMTGVAAGWLIEALIDQAKLEPAGDALAASGFGEEIPDSFMLNYLLHARGRLRLVRGDTDAGIADLRELWERAAAWNGPSPMTLPWLSSDLAVALVRRGELGEARHLAQQELAVARSWGSPCAVGVALRTSGLVEGGDRGLELLTEAAATLEHSEGRLEYARALADLGTALRGAGNQRDARERLSEGMELASRCAATALFERAREELRAAGARPPPRALTGADLLTSSERQIAEMASEGMSNKEIAQALFATMHTVETSLPHAYGKLGIASRRQLRRALRKR